jgi:hypothetical protein
MLHSNSGKYWFSCFQSRCNTSVSGWGQGKYGNPNRRAEERNAWIEYLSKERTSAVYGYEEAVNEGYDWSAEQ